MNQAVALTVNRPSVIFDVQGDETVIIDLSTGHYFRLDGASTALWRHFEHSVAPAALLEACTTRDQLSPVMAGIVDELLERGLVRVATANDGEAVTPGAWEFRGFTLEPFTDLEDILGLDPIHEVDTDKGWPHAAAG